MRFSGFEINDQLDFRDLLDRQIGWLLAIDETTRRNVLAVRVHTKAELAPYAVTTPRFRSPGVSCNGNSWRSSKSHSVPN
jgi:hypothetical protein